jgi:hypothetical protein
MGMDEINDLGKYLRGSKENVKVELPISPKRGNTALVPWFALGMIVTLVAVFAFLMLLPFALSAASAGVSLGMNMVMYLVTRAAAFAGILAFLYFGVRACRTGLDRSRGCIQEIGWGALIIAVVLLTLAAFIVLVFFSFSNF